MKHKIFIFSILITASLIPSPVAITGGGTALTTLTQYYLLIGNGNGVSLLAPHATSGVPLVAQGAGANPAYTTAIVAGGGTGLTSMSTYALLAGGTTSTGNLQQVASLGTSGQFLTSAGSAALPTWATPPTFSTASVTLTSAQVKTLNATPVTVVAAAGSGTFIRIISIATKMTYGSSVFVATASQTLSLSYTNGAGTSINPTILSNAAIVASSSQIQQTVASVGFTTLAATSAENQNVVVFNPIATEISGNAANDNTITVMVIYETLTL